MKASVFVGTSLDGFIARIDGSLDFLPPGGGEPHGYDEFMATVDALVIGRNTYETVLGFDAWPYAQKPVFVLSTRPLAKPPSGAVVEHIQGTPAYVVSLLEKRGVQHIYVDGGITIQAFLEAGLVQHLTILRVCPFSSAPAYRSLAPPRATFLSNISPHASTQAVSFRASTKSASNTSTWPA
jgi:dihydrofolate reductase